MHLNNRLVFKYTRGSKTPVIQHMYMLKRGTRPLSYQLDKTDVASVAKQFKYICT